MQIIPLLLKELDLEAQTTRKFLKLVPTDKMTGNHMKKA